MEPFGGASSRAPPPLQLDLRQLPREDGPPSETQLRRAKFQHFSSQCSLVGERLYLSGEVVAKSAEILQANGISHVLNCVGMLCQEYFKDQGIQYRTYHLHGEATWTSPCGLRSMLPAAEYAYPYVMLLRLSCPVTLYRK